VLAALRLGSRPGTAGCAERSRILELKLENALIEEGNLSSDPPMQRQAFFERLNALEAEFARLRSSPFLSDAQRRSIEEAGARLNALEARLETPVEEGNTQVLEDDEMAETEIDDAETQVEGADLVPSQMAEELEDLPVEPGAATQLESIETEDKRGLVALKEETVAFLRSVGDAAAVPVGSHINARRLWATTGSAREALMPLSSISLSQSLCFGVLRRSR
jgi:hypothetical protein